MPGSPDHRRRWLGRAATVVVALGSCAAPPPTPRLAGLGTVVVTIRDLRHDDGMVLVNLFLGPDGFPGDPRAAHAAVAAPIRGGAVEVRFERVPAGPFAVAAFHDEDGDRELDADLLGIPTEPWGVSRDAAGFLGPPSFDTARLELRAGEVLEIEIGVG
jgi:uncharacterized protein (DUF2141 family)